LQPIQQFACAPNVDAQAWNFQGVAINNVTISGYIKDATTNNAIDSGTLSTNGISCQFVNNSTGVTYTATILTGGIYTVQLPPGTYTRTVSCTSNYYANSTYTNITFTINSDQTNSSNQIPLAPVVTGGYRIVLTWGSTPVDLDAHLICPDGTDVNYTNTSYLNGGVVLNHDERNGYGPECNTISGITTGLFKYYVNRYTHDYKLINSQATVVVYWGSTQVKQYIMPINQSENSNWYVFSLQIDTNVITDINLIEGCSLLNKS